MNTEEDEFKRIEAEAKRRAAHELADTLTIVYQNGYAGGKKAAQREWQELTDEEMSDIVADMDVDFGDLLWKVVCLTKIIQATIKERNT